MLPSASLAVSLVLSAAWFPALAPLFTEAARFRRAANEGKASFSALVKQGAALEKRAARELERIQSAGYGLEEEDARRFDGRTSPGARSRRPRARAAAGAPSLPRNARHSPSGWRPGARASLGRTRGPGGWARRCTGWRRP
jgi:hypothetical protein